MSLLSISAPHFVAGLVLQDNVVVKAAPILRWTIGKRREWLENYFLLKGWKTVVVEES